LHYWDTQPGVQSWGPDKVAELHLAVAELLRPALAAVIADHVAAGAPVIFEGDYLLPDLVAGFCGNARAVVVDEPDEDQVVDDYHAREPQHGEQRGRARVSTRVGGAAGGPALSGLPDPGPGTTRGLPLVRAGADAFLLPGDGPLVSAAGYRLARLAAATGLAWAVAAVALIGLTLSDLLGRLVRSITRPGQMYPIGLLFGVGFDTATEVLLLAMAGIGAAAGLPWYAILGLPLLFAAGMSLFDTLDGTFMTIAYQWAFASPVRKAYYNLAITGLSVAVTLVIGTVELIAVAHDRLGLTNPVTDRIATLDLGNVGFLIVGLFIAVWAIAIAYWRVARVEHRWNPSHPSHE
jgi:hypothetical protein